MKIIFFALGLAVLGSTASRAATITVATTNDSGTGSLRQAILDANASSASDVIAFTIPGAGPHVIALASSLPTITQPVTIDGFSQPGASSNTLAGGNNAVLQVRLDGAGAFGATGLRLRASDCVIRGLSITRFAGDGLDINGVTNCVVAGNFIGLAPDGIARANNGNGVLIFDTPGNRIGGTASADRNVLSGNFTAGVQLLGVGASNNVIEGNFIGTSPDGAAARPNFVHGVYLLDAPRNRIGGTMPAARNVISGNTPDGIRLSGSESVGNVVLGNFIGPAASGAARLGSQNGVNIQSGATNRVGGNAPGEANVISGNSGFGVGLSFGASGNLILGNRIGLDPTGGVLSNGAQGILINGSGNRVGGMAPGEGNEIAFNAPGIEVELGTGNAIRGNSIHDNRPRFAVFGGLGIDLAPFGVTTNDVTDADGGPNLLQNFPLLTAATASAMSTRAQGTLNSRPSATFALDFYSNPDCDPSGHGEGLKFLGSTSVTTDGSGNASFDVTLPVAAEGRQITATATDADGNTSEFSPCFAASVDLPPQTLFVTNTNDSGPGSLRQALLDAQAAPAAANNVVAFNIDAGAGVALQAAGAGGDTLVIRLTTPLAPIFEAVTIDGFTQPGSSANTLLDGNNAVWRIRLEGSQLGAGADGLSLGASGCEVRGLEVAGFRGFGIHVTAEGDSSLVEGCHILDNQSGGVYVDNAGNVIIGGNSPDDRNVIHGNGVGVQISGAAGTDNLVIGNIVAPDSVFITDFASGNLVGGTAPSAGNRLAGVIIFSGQGNDVIGNSIVGQGIELFPGANGDLAAPTISSANILADGVECAGTFFGQPNTTYRFHTYSSRTPNANGEFYLGEDTASTDGFGIGNFTITTGGTFIGRHLTVTLTGPNEGTSELSVAFTPDSVRPPGTFTVTTTADDGLGSLRQTLTDADNYLAAGNNVIAFNVAGAGVHIIHPLSPLPLPVDPITIDGFTQPGSQPNTRPDGYNAVHRIQVDGALQGGGAAFSLTAGGSVVRGLSITRFEQGLELGGEGGHIVQGNLIGVDSFFQPAGNTRDAVVIGSPNNLVGGTNPEDKNFIGANGRSGIVLEGQEASDNLIQGNLIGAGLDVSVINSGIDYPHIDLGNGGHGIRFRFGASDNLVGGEEPGAENVLGFNALNAVSVESGQRNTILNNRFVVQPVPTTAEKFIALGPGANNNILPLTFDYAHSDNLNLRLGFRYTGQPLTTHQVETYFGEKVAEAPFDLRVFKPIHRFNLTTDGSGQASREELVTEVSERFARGFAILRDLAGNSSAASDLVRVVPAGSADLQTRLFVPASSTVGSNFTVTVVVTNSGPSTATNVTVRQILAPGVEIVSVSAPGSHTINGSVVDFAVGNLAAGQATTIMLTARGTQPTSYQFSARAQHQGVDLNWRNDTDQATPNIVPPPEAPKADVAVLASALGDSLAPGEIGTFQFNVDNNGLAAAANVRAAIKLPLGTFVESVDAPPDMSCEVTGGYLSCTLASLPAGQTRRIIVRARCAGNDAGTATEDIEIKAWSDTADLNAKNNSDEESIRITTPLSLFYDGTAHRVAWPAPSPGVELQSTASLTPPTTWTAVLANSIVTANGANTLTIPPQAGGSPPAQFYRLANKPPPEPQVEFDQLSLELDGVELPFTDWGEVSLKLPRADGERYVNVSYNDNWVIQNVPILSDLSSVAEVLRLCFPLDTNGAPVFTANTGLSVSTNLATGPPPSTNTTFFGSATRVLASGEQGVRLAYQPAQPLVGGAALRTAQAKPNFPNREQRKNECAPAAIVNSLQYLDAVFGLQLPEADISLQAIKDAMRWDSTGAPLGDDPLNPDWVQGKQQYMRNRNLPIVTEVTTNAVLALAAVRSMYDVEMRMTGHAACVVGITELGGGRYTLTLSHDVIQSDGLGSGDGGNILEIVTLDTNTGKLTGTWASGDFGVFIIERPEL